MRIIFDGTKDAKRVYNVELSYDECWVQWKQRASILLPVSIYRYTFIFLKMYNFIFLCAQLDELMVWPLKQTI